MTNAVNQTPPETDAIEPKANWRPVPVWLLVVILLLVFWGMLYFDQHGGWFSQEVYGPYRSEAEVAAHQPVMSGPNIGHGKTVYENVCALCHNPDGEGKPNQAPPLAGSEWVVGPPNRLIRIPLYGLNGPVTVKGQQMVFPAGMLAMGAALPEDDLASVLTYMRQAWGNKGSEITAAQIKAIKTEVGNRPQAFTPEELMQLPEK